MSAPEPTLPVGKRIQYLRERAGKTRPVVAGLLGKSASWLKAVETGRLQPPRLPTLLRIAEVLGVRDLADLVGDERVPVTVTPTPGHPALLAVREALISVTVTPPARAPSIAHLRARLDTAWQVRHASAHHRTALGELLPGLLRDAQAAVLASEGTERRAANAVLAEALNLSQMFLAYQPAPVLLWRAADRALLAAQESADPVATAGAVWFLAQAHRDAGEWDEAQAVAHAGMELLEPLLPDAHDPEVLAMWGALQFEAAYTAARVGEAGTAWRHWDEAERAARRLPADYYQRATSFSRVIMGAHATTIGVELRHGGEAVRQADRTPAHAIPSRPRRARHLIEVARGQYLRGDVSATLVHLNDAYESAPETIRFNSEARRIIVEVLDRQPAVRRQAHGLAERVGLLT